MAADIAILGVFVADLAFVAERLPRIGETLMGESFALGPGGKGSNQAVAASRAGVSTAFVTKLGDDPFASMARKAWAEAGIADVSVTGEVPTGAAMIFVESASRDNAIIVEPGAGASITTAEVDKCKDVIASAKVFMTQLEQPAEVALHGLRLAKDAGVTTVFDPAPAAAPLDPAIYQYCDYVTPNETEAGNLSGIEVSSVDQARKAADFFLKHGVKCPLITLGEQGALIHDGSISELIPSVRAGDPADTTGAGDSFDGALACALAEGQDIKAAVRFACAAAGISVTRPGTAPAMPTRAEIDQLLQQG